MEYIIFSLLALAILGIGGYLVYKRHNQTIKQEQENLKASAECASECDCILNDAAVEDVKIALAVEPKVSETKKKPAKKKAKKSVKKSPVAVEPEIFNLQPVEPKPRKPRAKKPVA